MSFKIECEQEQDGRWIAEGPDLPGVFEYGETSAQAISRVEILARRVIAEQLEYHETGPKTISIVVPA